MRKLFKAAIRSLKSMKTTVIGLTVLIFLSSTIFTLLSDVQNAYSSKFKDYNNVSRLHDVTFDLDLNNEGSLGGDSAYSLDKEETYMVKGTEGNKEVLLTQGYQSINELSSNIKDTSGNSVNTETSIENGKEVKTNMFDTALLAEEYQLFQTGLRDGLSAENTKSRFVFDLANKTFRPKSDYHINMYQLSDGDQEAMVEDFGINVGDTITWDSNDYRLATGLSGSDSNNTIGSFSIEYKSAWIFSYLRTFFKPKNSIYINKKTKVATLKAPVNPNGSEWFVISHENTAPRNIGETLFGLKYSPNEKHWDVNKGYVLNEIFKQGNGNGINWDKAPLLKDINGNHKVKLNSWYSHYYMVSDNDNYFFHPNNSNYRGSEKISSLKLGEFKWPESFGNIPYSEQKASAVLEAGTQYDIPSSWIESIKNEIFYTKHIYKLNDYSKWTGSYNEWILDLKKNDIDEFNNLQSFAYWTKTVRKDGYTYDPNKDKANPNGDFLGVLLTHDVDSTIYQFEYDDKKQITNKKSETKITNIENFVKENEQTYDRSEFLQHFADITNKDKLSERLTYISQNAQIITRKNVEDHVRSIAGTRNVGTRRTMTVSSFDKIREKTQVFHFVDAHRNTINIGTEENPNYVETVDKMYYEQKFSTELLTLDSTEIVAPDKSKIDVGKMPPPPSFSAYMINSIFRGFYINPEYFDADVVFEKIKTSKGILNNQKLVKIVDTNNNELYVTKINDEFYILNSNFEVAKRDGKSLEGLTYEQMATYLLIEENNKKPFNISGTIGQNGWFKVSPRNKNIIIPVQYRNLPASATERAVTSNEYDVFIAPIISTLEGIFTTGDNPWMTSEILSYLSIGIEEAMKNNSFYSVMETGVVDRAAVGKLVFETLYYADQRNTSQPILNRVFTDLITHIKNEVVKAGDKDAQKAKFEKEIKSVQNMMQNVFGMNIPLDISKFAKYTSDPLEFLDVFDKLIKSISSNKWLSEIKNWYDNNWEGIKPGIVRDDFGNPLLTKDGQIQYHYFGTRELLTPLFGGAINETLLKDAFKSLVTNLDFNLIEKEIKDVIRDEFNSNNASNLIKIIDKIQKGFNNKDSGKEIFTHNLQYVVWNLIDKLNVNETMRHISNSFQEHSFKKVVDGEETWFLGAFTTQVDMVTSVTKGIFSNSSILDDVKNILINGLNLSFKTVLPDIDVPGDSNVKAPGQDEDKLDLFDVQKAEALNYSNLEDSFNILHKWDTGLDRTETNRIKVEETISSYYSSTIISNNNFDDLAKRLYKIYYQFSLNKFSGKHGSGQLNPYSRHDVDGHNNNPLSQIGKNATLADSSLWTIKNSFKKLTTAGIFGLGESANDGSNEQAYGAVKETVESSPFAAGANSLVMYNWYFNFMNTYIKDLENKGISRSKAIDKTFELLNIFIDASINENIPDSSDGTSSLFNILKESQEVDNHEVDTGILGIVISQPTVGSSVMMDPKGYENSVMNHESLEVLFKEIENNLGRNSETIKFIFDNKDDFISQLASLAYAKDRLSSVTNKSIPSVPDTGLETSRWFLVNRDIMFNKEYSPFKNLLENEEDFNVVVNISNSLSTQSNVFKFLGINPAVASTYLGIMFPGVAKSNTVAFDQNQENQGNLGFVLEGKLRNFGDDSYEELRDSFSKFISDDMLPFEVENHGSIPLRLDMYQLKDITNKMRRENNDKLFDLNLADLLDSIIDSSTEIVDNDNQIRFLNIGAYVSKVSESYMKANNKKAYTKKLPNNVDDMLTLLNTVDQEHIINVNNQKFLVLGKETAVDYMYPVLDEANLNVDTENQAVIFVNQFGFERVVQANQDTTVKEYLTIRADDWKGGSFDINTGELVAPSKLNSLNADQMFIADSSKEGLRDALRLKTKEESIEKVFLATENDPINPERSMRVTTIQTVINAVAQMQFYGVLFLLTLVGAITVFISIRYIDNRRIVIGILRAQGYSKWRIAVSFTIFATFTGLIGGVIGYLSGHFMQIPVMNTFASFWTVPTTATTFSWASMFLTTLAPIIGMIILIIISAFLVLRAKTVNLMSGSNEAASGWFARNLIKPFKKFSIITKFRATLAFNSFFKLLSLSFAILLSAVVGIFSLSSFGVFERAVDKTYSQRDYKYSIDLYTPTIEGGGYDVIDKNNISSIEQLYIPMGNNLEGNTYTWDYFKPGASSIMDLKYNGNQSSPEGRSHIMSKSSLDITINTAIAANPWQLAKNSMPDSQYVSALDITAIAAVEMMFTQIEDLDIRKQLRQRYLDIIDEWRAGTYPVEGQDFNPWKHSGAQYYLEGKDSSHNDRVVDSYYIYLPTSNNEGKFIQRIYSPLLHSFDNKGITTDPSIREGFRNFLKKAYQNQNVNDYFIMYGGVAIDKSQDETYTWADTTLGNSKTRVKVTGIGIEEDVNGNILDSYSMPTTSGGEDIRRILLDNYRNALEIEKTGIPLGSKDNPIPIAPNEVVKRVWNLSQDQILKSNAYNLSNRFLDQFKSSNTSINKNNLNREYFSKVVAFNTTYINTEIISIQEAINSIIGLNQVKWRGGIKPFNGVFTQNNVPSQAIESLSLYSQSGYWAGLEGISFPLSDSTALNIARNLFGDPRSSSSINGALFEAKDSNGNHVYTEEDMSNMINSVFPESNGNIGFDNLKNELSKDSKDPSLDIAFINSVLTHFNNVYGKTLYSAAMSGLSAKDIEAGFVTNISGTVNIITSSFIAVSAIVSLIVMMIISTMIVNENKKKIATFSVMGYSEYEKIKMFLFVYIPFIAVAVFASIPISFGVITLFNAVILGTANMALPLAANWVHITIATLIIFAVFAATISIAYLAIRKIKPIYILQGDD